MLLHRGLHEKMGHWRQFVGSHEGRRKRGIWAMHLPVERGCVIRHRFSTRASVCLKHLAIITDAEDRLDTARHVSSNERDGAGGCNGGEKPVAQAVFGDIVAQIVRQVRSVA